ncbi:MAG: GNAT family N-acetyltransferase [Acutalibacteraceae bacterium]|nr:GNAT family N-acetyltransferase [Acutalibacteraceae bacterium]
MTKFNCFLENAEMLNEKFNIVPLLYGSLGLEVLTKSSLNADDIDILIPQVFVTGDKWTEFKLFLESHGYILIDEHEHTFRKDSVDYSYASLEGLKKFAGIDICDIEIRNISGTKFMLLSLAQYLKVYQKSSQDGYRMNVKEKQDNQKIEFIKKKLYSVIKLKVTELSMLTTLFNYKDVNEMITENTRDIENGVVDIFALFDRDKIIGELRVKYISDDKRFAVKGKRAYLYAFRIHKKYQGKGLGNFLLENVLTILAENGYREFTVGVEDDNTKARYMYEKYGFAEPITRIKESYQGDSYEYDLLLKA